MTGPSSGKSETMLMGRGSLGKKDSRIQLEDIVISSESQIGLYLCWQGADSLEAY